MTAARARGRPVAVDAPAAVGKGAQLARLALGAADSTDDPHRATRIGGDREQLDPRSRTLGFQNPVAATDMAGAAHDRMALGSRARKAQQRPGRRAAPLRSGRE